jgi:hypothetical protein
MSQTFRNCANDKSPSAASSQDGSPLLERSFLGGGPDDPAALSPAVKVSGGGLRLLFSGRFSGGGAGGTAAFLFLFLAIDQM